ncbi:MAG: lytic transglycosylase domain-containing protein, partial [Candidatus Zixiibacteriota bacterium]
YNKELPSSKKYEIANEIYTMSLKYTNLDVDFLCATITEESGGTWDPKTISKTGAMGLMQIMPATGMFLAKYEDITWTSAEEILLDPIYNIRLGARYLSVLIDLYGVDGGLAAYNGGEKYAALWLVNNKAEGILHKETKDYIPAVLQLYEEYQNLKL